MEKVFVCIMNARVPILQITADGTDVDLAVNNHLAMIQEELQTWLKMVQAWLKRRLERKGHQHRILSAMSGFSEELWQRMIATGSFPPLLHSASKPLSTTWQHLCKITATK